MNTEAIKTCQDCGKPTPPDSVHTCSPQVQLPPLPYCYSRHHPGDNSVVELFTADQMRDYARQALLSKQPVTLSDEQDGAFVWYVPDDCGRPYKTTGYLTDAIAWRNNGQKVIAVPLSSAQPSRAEILEEAARVCDQIENGKHADGYPAAGTAWECAAAIRALGAQQSKGEKS